MTNASISTTVPVTPRELATILSAAIGAGLNTGVSGAPGIGKTDIAKQAAAAAHADLHIWHPSVSDPTDFKGLPWFDPKTGAASFRPFEHLSALTEGRVKRRTVVLVDDVGQASPATQAALMQPMWGGQINGVKISPLVSFILATNRRSDKAGVTGLLEPVKSRCAGWYELQASIDDWCEWAYANGIDPVLVAFLRYKPDLLSAFVATPDLVQSPSPRTWTFANQMLKLGLPAPLESKAVAGAVGEGAAVEFLTFRRMYQQLVNVDAILKNPDTAAIPGKPNERFAVSVALASRATAENLKRIAVYVERVYDAGFGEFAALTIRDAIRRDETLQYSDAFVRIAASRIGQLFSGKAA